MSAEQVTSASGNQAQRHENLVVEVTADVTLTPEDSGTTYLVGTDALTVTLPPTKKGVRYKFINSGADGNNIITVSPNASDAIFGTVQNAAQDNVSGGTDDKDIINTKATANKGDYIILEGDGADGWYIVGGVGIWASEA